MEDSTGQRIAIAIESVVYALWLIAFELLLIGISILYN